jgi:hypothetical protein
MNITTVVALFFVGHQIDFYMSSIEMILTIFLFYFYLILPLMKFLDVYQNKDILTFFFLIPLTAYLVTIILFIFYSFFPTIINNILTNDNADVSFIAGILDPIPHFYLYSLIISLMIIVFAQKKLDRKNFHM